MRAITGSGGGLFGNNGFVRDNMPLHDLTGGNTWVPQIIPLHPDYAPLFSQVVDSIDGKEYTRGDYLANGVERARQMLRNAARLEVAASGAELTVTVYNDSGHKLPTGYVEGRRMWLQVEGYDQHCNLIYTSGAYDATTATLDGYHTDPSLKVYESKQGLTQEWANTLGLAAGPTFHFALNNLIVSDNRIPPRGYNFVAFNGRQAAPYTDGKPDPAMYADGQYWDTTTYGLPEAVAWGNVRLFYQTASKEYIEFLRDSNPNEGRNNGDILYDLWQQSGRSTPEQMTEARFGSGSCQLFLPTVNGS